MTPEQLIRRLREYDKHNHRGKYATLCHEAADFIEAAFTPTSGDPEKPVSKPPKNSWALTPSARWGKQQCESWIQVLRGHGCNALILNEKGVMEYGTVERLDAAGGGNDA